jgi:hypothetical protein
LKAGGEPLATKMLNSGLFNPADDMLTKRDVQLKTEDQETALAVQMVDEQVGSRRPTRSRKPTRMPRLGCARTAQHARRRCITPRMQIRRVAPAPAGHGDVVQAEAASAAAAKGALVQYLDGATAGWAGCNVGDAMPAGSSAPAPSHGSGSAFALPL